MKTNNQELPKWFTGMLYTAGDEVTNPFTGDSYVLSPAELSMYDFLIGANHLFERCGTTNKVVNEFQKGLMWFRRANPAAYRVLLD